MFKINFNSTYMNHTKNSKYYYQYYINLNIKKTI